MGGGALSRKQYNSIIIQCWFDKRETKAFKSSRDQFQMRMNLQNSIRCNVSRSYINKSLLVCNHLMTVIVVNNIEGPNRPFEHQYNIKQILLITPTQTYISPIGARC